MKIIGRDLYARQQTLAMLDTNTGEVVKKTLKHEGNHVREFYSSLARPARVGIEATGSMQWFLNLSAASSNPPGGHQPDASEAAHGANFHSRTLLTGSSKCY